MSATNERIVFGITLRLLAMTFFALLGGAVKWAAEQGAPLWEIIFFRSAFAFIPLLIYVQQTTGFSVLKTSRPGGHMVRVGIGVVAMMCTFASISMLPLMESTALSFTAPLFLTALSAPILRERVDLHRWAAVVVGFTGVLIMVRPEPGHMAAAGTLFGLAGGFFSAGAMIAIRQIARTEPTPTIVFYFTLAGTVVGFVGMLFQPVVLEPTVLVVLALAGVVGGLGQMAMTEALSHAPVAVLAPFDYSQLVWATLLGYFIWDQLPQPWTVAGAAVVAASGLYIVYREVRRARR